MKHLKFITTIKLDTTEEITLEQVRDVLSKPNDNIEKGCKIIDLQDEFVVFQFDDYVKPYGLSAALGFDYGSMMYFSERRIQIYNNGELIDLSKHFVEIVDRQVFDKSIAIVKEQPRGDKFFRFQNKYDLLLIQKEGLDLEIFNDFGLHYEHAKAIICQFFHDEIKQNRFLKYCV